MLNYIIRRILLFFPTLIGMTLVVFLVMAWSPGGVGGSLLNQVGNMKANQAAAIRKYLTERYGLNEPVMVQYVHWLNLVSPVGFSTNVETHQRTFGFKAPDLGFSFSKGRPVSDLLLEAVPITLLLNVVTIPLIYVISILVGIYSAYRRGSTFDRASGSILLALWCVPTMCAGVLLIGFLANREYVQVFPTGGLHDTLATTMSFLPSWASGNFERGWLLDTMWHLAMPVFCLTYGGFAFLTRLTRSAMLDNLSADYARTARAKGVSERVMLFRHVFRNSLLPLITVAAQILPSLIAGSIIVESIFSIHGMGLLIIEAVDARDRDLVLAEALIAGILGLVSYLISDLCYALADPRVSYE
ncbi:MAG TPA: ABC transporter permease [Tepidisphaeraceae bacterium]|jgi:peptide/nickel transport system permease protein